MAPPHQQNSLVSELFQLAREMRNAIDHELQPHGVTAQQAALVLVTHLQEGCGVSHLAETLGTDAAGITRLVDRLEAKGVLQRGDSPIDRRLVLVKVTPGGERLTPDLKAAFERAHERLLEGIEPADIQQLHTLVAGLRETLAPFLAGLPASY